MMYKNAASSGHDAVTGAAMMILEAGGNAFDAAVAAGFASAVSEPALNSLGGGGFLLARTASGRETLFDFFVNTPGAGLPEERLADPHFLTVTVNFPGCEQDFNVGLGSVAVPGTLMGLLHIHERLCTMPLELLLEPAVKLARHGVRLNHHQGYFLNLLTPIMTLTERSREIFGHGETYLKAGELLVNPDLADFLEQLPADLGDSFYRGELARKISDEMERHGGLLTFQDLESFRVIERKPLATSYRGRRIITNCPPSSGGPLITIAMKLMEKIDLSGASWGDATHVAALCGCMTLVDRARRKGRDAPDRINPGWYDSASRQIAEMFRDLAPVSAAEARSFSRGTTHISICDIHGNAASMTCSNGEGSGYIVPGTGIMLNNMMGEDDLHPQGFHSSPPGIRVSSMMSPSMVTGSEGVELVLGSGGSKRIRTAIMQVMINYLDFHLDIRSAVEAPRIHLDGETVQMEPGYPDEAVTVASRAGQVNVWKEPDVYFGGVHAVEPEGGCAGDPRRGGVCQTADAG